MRKATYTDEQFIEAVKNNFSVATVFKELKLKPTGGNYKHFYKKCLDLNVDTKHFTGQIHHTKQTAWNKKSIDKIYCLSNQRLNYYQRSYLIVNKILGDVCSNCKQGDNWFGSFLKLQIDHIDGNPNDNRIQNLRLLCPNCHSQTPTYGGLNKKNNNIKNGTLPDPIANQFRGNYKTKCKDCSAPTYRLALRCKECDNKYVSSSSYEDDYDLINRIQHQNISEISRDIGISRTAIRKRLRKLGHYS